MRVALSKTKSQFDALIDSKQEHNLSSKSIGVKI